MLTYRNTQYRDHIYRILIYRKTHKSHFYKIALLFIVILICRELFVVIFLKIESDVDQKDDFSMILTHDATKHHALLVYNSFLCRWNIDKHVLHESTRM